MVMTKARIIIRAIITVMIGVTVSNVTINVSAISFIAIIFKILSLPSPISSNLT